MAEAVFAHKAEEAGLKDRIETDSAGTGSWHIGKPPHPSTLAMLAEHGISTTHRARRISQEDLNRFDLILTMDDQNFLDVNALGTGSAKVVRLLDYAPQFGIREVPDPYHIGGYDRVFELVSAASEGLLAEIHNQGLLTSHDRP